LPAATICGKLRIFIASRVGRVYNGLAVDTLGWIFLAVTVLLLAVVGYAFFVRNRRVKEEPVQHFQCPQCRQRLSYRERQAGHKGACPRCRTAITFPAKRLPKRK
jgi:hypothetical protein